MSTHLSAFPLFDGLSDGVLAALETELDTPQHYARGASIYGTQEFRRAIGLIVSGTVTVHTPTDGRALMMNRLTAGDMFGAAALFDAADTYVTTVTAEEETDIVFLSQDTVSDWLRRYPPLAENYIRFLSGRIRFLNHKVSMLTGGSAESRLYGYLQSHQAEDGRVHMPKSMVELAHTLHIGRSSLYRALDALTDSGILLHEGSCYRLVK